MLTPPIKWHDSQINITLFCLPNKTRHFFTRAYVNTQTFFPRHGQIVRSLGGTFVFGPRFRKAKKKFKLCASSSLLLRDAHILLRFWPWTFSATSEFVFVMRKTNCWNLVLFLWETFFPLFAFRVWVAGRPSTYYEIWWRQCGMKTTMWRHRLVFLKTDQLQI